MRGRLGRMIGRLLGDPIGSLLLRGCLMHADMSVGAGREGRAEEGSLTCVSYIGVAFPLCVSCVRVRVHSCVRAFVQEGLGLGLGLMVELPTTVHDEYEYELLLAFLALGFSCLETGWLEAMTITHDCLAFLPYLPTHRLFLRRSCLSLGPHVIFSPSLL